MDANPPPPHVKNPSSTYALLPQRAPTTTGRVHDASVAEPPEAIERAWREQGAKLWRSVVAFGGDPELASDAMAEALRRRSVVVGREPVVLRVVSKVGEPPTRSVAAWVGHAEATLRWSEERMLLHSVDPLEQMRQMAASLKQSV